MSASKYRISAAVLALATGVAVAGGPPHGRMDADGDGAISREEAMQMRMKMFDKLDADGNGYISAEERETAREKMAARHEKMREERQARHEKKMKRLDSDGDGRISKTEMQNGPMPMFEKADTNGDGKLSKEEMRAMHGKHHKGMSGSHHGEPK